jgi:hypothetical protein
MSGESNEMPKLLAGWLLSSKSYDTDTDDDTIGSDGECPFDVRCSNYIIMLYGEDVFISITLI